MTFTSLTTTVCTVSGSTVTIKAAGTCAIQAAQAGTTSYNAASNVGQGFTVAKANQTITFAAPATVPRIGTVRGERDRVLRTRRDLPLAPRSACARSAAAPLFLGGGRHLHAPGGPGGNANYNAAPSVSQSFSVAPASQTMTFAAIPGQILGAAPLALSATSSSGLPVAFASLTPALCTVAGSSLTLVAAGICTIQATQPGNASYSAAPPVSQSFAIIAAARFATALTYGTGNLPEGIAVGDFNGDGIADMAIANAFSAAFSILIGNGDGTFVTGNAVQTGGEPVAVAVGDFTGDGKLDLAVADLFGNNVFILTGNGTGAFVRSATLAMGPAPVAIALSDFNGDGKPDLAVVNGSYGSTTGRTVSIALGNGDGSFRAPATYATVPIPTM